MRAQSLLSYVNRHPHMTITALTVSAQSNDAGKLIFDLHPQLKGIVDLPLQPMSDISEFTDGVDVVFLATAHEVSHDLAPQFLAAGCVVFDPPARSALTTCVLENIRLYSPASGFASKSGLWSGRVVRG